MTSPVRPAARRRVTAVQTDGSEVSARWLASVLVVASLLELTILRIGTRTAIHIPGLEQIAGPYRLFASAGRLAFFVAVVLLILLLPYLAGDLYRRGRTHTAAGLSSFVFLAGLGAFGVVGNSVLAPAVTAVVASLGITVLARQLGEVRVVAGLFVLAFLMSALHSVIQSGAGGDLADGFRQLPRIAEVVAVLAAICSGPLVRRSLGLGWFPTGRHGWATVAVGVFVTGAILANASTVHILMLWNFGLTGALPAPIYGLAAASLVVAVASSVRSGHQHLALALTLFFLGGIGLTSTYQSGLVVAGLGLLDLAATTPAKFVRSNVDRGTN